MRNRNQNSQRRSGHPDAFFTRAGAREPDLNFITTDGKAFLLGLAWFGLQLENPLASKICFGIAYFFVIMHALAQTLPQRDIDIDFRHLPRGR